MRVAVVFEWDTLNGGERSLLAVLDRLAGDVEFVAIAPGGGRLATALKQRHVPRIPLQLRNASGERLPREQVCRQLRSATLRSRAELLHANSLAMGRLTGAVADSVAVPTSAHLRDIIKLSRAAIGDLNRNRLLVAVSQATSDFHARQGCDPHRLLTVYNGVDCQEFSPRPPTGWLKRKLGLPPEAFLIATIGQIGLRKGQDVLADAAVLARDRLPDVHYLLIGERNSSKSESIEFERRTIDRFVQGAVRNRLHCLGYRNDVPELLNEVDLLVHPAHQEPLGRVLLEAAASGLPIVATDVGGTREIVADGASALLVPPNDPQSLRSAIVRMHDRPGLRRRLAAEVREQVVTNFAIDRAAVSLYDAWRRCRN